MIQKNSFSILIILVLILSACVSSPPEKPDNICDIFQEKRSWYKAAIRSEKRWKLPPYVLMAFIHQESSFQAKIKPKRNKLLGGWVSDKLKKTDKDKEDYILEVIKSDMLEPGDEDVFRKVKNDLSQGGFENIDEEIRNKMNELMEVAKKAFL